MSREKTLLITIATATVVAVGLLGYGLFAGSSNPARLINPSAQSPAPAPTQATTTLLFTGDIMLSRGVAQIAEQVGNGSPHYPFERVRDVLREADIAIGNLEGPISARGTNQGSKYSFRAEPKMADGLAFAGFDVLALANNHIWDWGAEALIDTKNILESRGIAAVGAGADAHKANAPYITEVNGTTFAFLSYTNLLPNSFAAGSTTPGTSNSNIEDLKSKILHLKSENDLVILLWHWGEEYVTNANEEQRRLAQVLAGAGADLIVGTHPHVVQELEEIGENKWAAYSLGNFIFDQGFSAQTMRGTMLKVEVVRGKIDAVSPVPISITSTFQPYIGGQAEPFLQNLPFAHTNPPVTLSEGFTAYDGALQDTPGALHKGIDYVRRTQDGEFLPFGVFSMHAGEALRGESETWGNYVLVRPTVRRSVYPYTIYGHLENIPKEIPPVSSPLHSTQRGLRVDAGTYLGDAGTSGNTKGIPQLHIELHEEDIEAGTTRKLDPYNIYDRASSGRYPQPPPSLKELRRAGGEALPNIRHYWTTNTPAFAE